MALSSDQYVLSYVGRYTAETSLILWGENEGTTAVDSGSMVGGSSFWVLNARFDMLYNFPYRH